MQSRLCVVMACTDVAEAEQVGQQLSAFDGGCLVTFRRAEDLMYNAPSRKVAMVVLATDDSLPVMSRMLERLRRRWPRCPVTVVGDEGGNEYELAARKGGAIYLTRPVEPQEWSAILAHVLDGQHQMDLMERPDRNVAAKQHGD